jgi:hypothetical protein
MKYVHVCVYKYGTCMYSLVMYVYVCVCILHFLYINVCVCRYVGMYFGVYLIGV